MPSPTVMFIHPALLPGSSTSFFSRDDDDDSAGAGTQPLILQVRVEVPPSPTKADGTAAPLLEPTVVDRPGTMSSSPAAVAFVLLFWAVVFIAGIAYWNFF